MKKARRIATPVSFEIGVALIEKTNIFDPFAPIIVGKAEIVADEGADSTDSDLSIKHTLPLNVVKINKQFKLISSLIMRKYD